MVASKIMGVFENMGRDFQQGYRNGQQQAENNPKMMIFIVLVVLLFVALYFIQKWTGIPVFDWAKSAIAWIGNGIMYLSRKLLDLI